jgi:hypothetical protein
MYEKAVKDGFFVFLSQSAQPGTIFIHFFCERKNVIYNMREINFKQARKLQRAPPKENSSPHKTLSNPG